MDALYFDLNQSAAFSGQNERTILNSISEHFIGNHPPLPFSLRIDFENGILCDQQGRYCFNFGDRFPDTSIGNHCTASGRIFIYKEHTVSFSISCIGPTQCMVNGDICYQSQPDTEGLHQEQSFQVSLHYGYNTFTFITEKTALGFGFFFRVPTFQEEPYTFQSPLPERNGQLGFVYTPPLSLDRARTAAYNPCEFSWFPLLSSYSKEELEYLYPDHVFGEHWYGTCYAMRQIRVNSYSILTLRMEKENTSQTGRTFRIYLLASNQKHPDPILPSVILDDTHTSCNLELKRGVYEVYIQIDRPLGKYHTSLTFQLLSGSINTIYRIHGYHGNWIYLGPFHEKLPKISDLSHLEHVYQDNGKTLYWKTSYPKTVLRICADYDFFGRWSHRMAPLLYGLLKAGNYLNRPDYCDYVTDDIKQIISYWNYALFDQTRFGISSLNQRLCDPTDIRDRGAFGFLALKCQTYKEIPMFDSFISSTAHYLFTWHQDHPFPFAPSEESIIRVEQLYPSVSFFASYYNKTSDPRYLEEACRQIKQYTEYFYIQGRHLLSHCYDPKWQKANQIPWAYGNSIALTSLLDVIEILPRNHEDREPFLRLFQDVVNSLLCLQDKSGLWHQILDEPSTCRETSSTALFLSAFCRSIRKGYIKDKHLNSMMRTSIQLAWDGLLQFSIDALGNVYGSCIEESSSFSRSYYRSLPLQCNDLQGIGLILLAGAEKCLLDE